MSFSDQSIPIPSELRTGEFVLRPITADDAELDYAAVVETRDELRLWEQSTWPADDFTVEDNRKDLVDLEERHSAHRAFTYTVLDPTRTESLGCVYVFPTSATFLARSTVTALGDQEWADVDAVVYFWVRASRSETGMDARLLAALRTWFARDWRFDREVYVTNEKYTRQLALVARTDLRPMFAIREPEKQGTYLAFGR